MVKHDDAHLYSYLIEEYVYQSKNLHTNCNKKLYPGGRIVQEFTSIVELQIKFILSIGCNKNQNDNENNESMLGMRKNDKKDDDYDEKEDRKMFSSFMGGSVVSCSFLSGTMAFILCLNNHLSLLLEQK